MEGMAQLPPSRYSPVYGNIAIFYWRSDFFNFKAFGSEKAMHQQMYRAMTLYSHTVAVYPSTKKLGFKLATRAYQTSGRKIKNDIVYSRTAEAGAGSIFCEVSSSSMR